MITQPVKPGNAIQKTCRVNAVVGFKGMGKTTLLLAQSLNVLCAERVFFIVVFEQVLSFALDLADWFLVIERGRIVHGAP